ncbi:MAG: hypothetical protein EBU01_13200 [Crocinitomicaceae bacterium]|nr:hypothetical protein [Crocinitomicaceae bacterium]
MLILRQMMEFEPKHSGTDLKEALKFLRNTHKRRAICFLLSDFEDDDTFIDDMKRTLKHHDLVAVKVKDKAEVTLPISGFIQFFNSETNETSWVNASSERTKRLFEKEFEFREQNLLQKFKSSGVDYVLFNTEENIVPPLVQLFKSRR